MIRFNRDLYTTDDDFKINNNHIPFYVRLLVLEYPAYKKFFKMKSGRFVNEWTNEDLIENLENIRVAYAS